MESEVLPSEATPAIRFFFENAGYCVGRRVAGAEDLANAERWVKGQDHRYTWTDCEYTWNGDEPLPKGCKHKDLLLEIFHTCPCCGVRKLVHTESLCSIAYMPGDSYPRVCEAELAQQARKALESV